MRVVPPSSGQEEGGPPEHWQRLVQSTRRGPPADWVERVRRGAPHLLEGLELEESPPVTPERPPVAVPPVPVAPVTPSRSEPVPAMGKGPSPQARPHVRLSRPSPPGREAPGSVRPVRPPEPQTPVSAATVVEHPVPTSAPSAGPRTDEPSSRPPRERGTAAPVPGPVRRDVQAAPREGGSNPAMPRAGTQEGARFTRARGLSFRPIPETSPSTESQKPESGFGSRPAGVGNPGPSIPSPRPSPGGRGVMGGVGGSRPRIGHGPIVGHAVLSVPAAGVLLPGDFPPPGDGQGRAVPHARRGVFLRRLFLVAGASGASFP